VFSTIPYISPHICKVLPLPKQDKAMVICVLTRMHDLMWEFALPNDGATTLHKQWKIYGINLVCFFEYFSHIFVMLWIVWYKYQHGINKTEKFDVDLLPTIIPSMWLQGKVDQFQWINSP